MSQNTLKVNELNEEVDFDENGEEAFDEKVLVEEPTEVDSSDLSIHPMN